MYLPPKDVIASWPPPNFIDPVTRSYAEVWPLKLIIVPLAFLCVIVRLWVRIFVRRWFGVDDALIVIALCCTISTSVLVTIGTEKYHWDRHIWDFPIQLAEVSQKVVYFLRILWALASSFVRISVIILYYRLLKACDAPKLFVNILHGTAICNVVLCIYYFIFGIFPCLPIRAFWTFGVPNAKCIDDRESLEVTAIINTIAEFALAALPILAAPRLKVAKEQRWSVICVLSLSFCVGIVGIVRTYYIFLICRTWDMTWYSNAHWVSAEIEINLSLICACAAPIRPVVTRLIKHLQRISSKKHLLPRKRTSGRSDSATIFDPRTKFTNDEVTKWATIMRAIDIEGINTDNYGYKVTVSGPPKKEISWGQGVLRTLTMNLLWSNNRSSVPNVSQDLEIPVNTEVTVSHSAHSVSRHDSNTSPATTSIDI